MKTYDMLRYLVIGFREFEVKSASLIRFIASL
jgi:hypothetical protein